MKWREPRGPSRLERSRRVLKERKNSFLLSLAVISFGSVVCLAALSEERFGVYLALLALAYFAASLAFKVRRRRNFDYLAAAMAIVFVAAIVSSLI